MTAVPAPADSTDSTRPAPQPASTAPSTRSAFTRFKVMAFVTGSFLLLLCVEMLLKYVLKVDWVDSALGWVPFVHGWIYLIYAVTCLQLWSQARWSFGRLVVMVAGGVVPVLSFVVEGRAARWPVAARRA
ncbi:MAG TPA: DUF3817 domain-containing protein [Micrococcales bacterium]|uniref:DUF3817 domain-containing protein n=1 Tax=Miniimonas arenae TaxID=676201 RepID=UPI000ECA1077|nr:DUF3817 domain-containing protein [Miniimonas arenae]HCX85719.1 DUF3817 domain-containing protein [Micrococcales bacterium]